jgi:hypothetical protein
VRASRGYDFDASRINGRWKPRSAHSMRSVRASLKELRCFLSLFILFCAETKVGRRRERGGGAVQLTPPKVSADQIRHDTLLIITITSFLSFSPPPRLVVETSVQTQRVDFPTPAAESTSFRASVAV